MNRTWTLLALALAAAALLSAWLLLDHDSARVPAAGRESPAAASMHVGPKSAIETPAAAREESEPIRSALPDASSPTAPPLAPAPQWRLNVLDERGSVVSGARVLVLESHGETWDASTDAEGAVHAQPDDGAADVFVAGVDRPLEAFQVARSAGVHSVSLTQAFAELAGLVTVNGARPAAPLALVFEPRTAPFAARELPKPLRVKLEAAARMSCRTDEAGHFSVLGVPRDWSGTLLIPRGHVARRVDPNAPPQRKLAIDAPATGLLLELERLPHLVGRVVDESGNPAPAGTGLRAAIHWAKGRSIANTIAELDAGGRFEIALREARIDKAELALETASGQLAIERVQDELQLDARGDLDVGTLVLLARRALHVRVLGADGRALRTAKARILGESTWSEAGEDGQCVVNTAAIGATTLSVIALEHWAQQLPVQLPTDEVVEVRLARSNRLELELVDPARAPLRDVVVRLASRGEPLFPESKSWWPDGEMIGVVRGSMRSGGQDVQDLPRGWLDLRPSPEGRIAIQGFSPAASIELAVLDVRGRSLLEHNLAPLAADELRSVELVVTELLVELVGRVRDSAGQPIAGALVQIAREDDDSETVSTQSDSSGSYAFRGLSGERVTLEVSAQGFAPAAALTAELASRATTFDIVLQRR